MLQRKHLTHPYFFIFCVVLSFCVVVTYQNCGNTSSDGGSQTLSGHVPNNSIVRALHIGRLQPDTLVKISVPLKVRDQAALTDFLNRLDDLNDPLYHKYLETGEFDQRFAATPDDIAIVSQRLTEAGLSVTELSPHAVKAEGSA